MIFNFLVDYLFNFSLFRLFWYLIKLIYKTNDIICQKINVFIFVVNYSFHFSLFRIFRCFIQLL